MTHSGNDASDEPRDDPEFEQRLRRTLRRVAAATPAPPGTPPRRDAGSTRHRNRGRVLIRLAAAAIIVAGVAGLVLISRGALDGRAPAEGPPSPTTIVTTTAPTTTTTTTAPGNPTNDP